jgi:hypothetical protein
MGIEDVRARAAEGRRRVQNANFNGVVDGLEDATPAKLSGALGELMLAVTRMQHVRETHNRPIIEACVHMGEAFAILEEVDFGKGEITFQVVQHTFAAAGMAATALRHEEYLKANLANLQAMLEEVATMVTDYEVAHGNALLLAREGVGMQAELLQQSQAYIKRLGS